MRHRASSQFWKHYKALPDDIRDQADRAFRLLKANPRHPSLHLKKVGPYWSVRVNLNYRALAVEEPGGLLWIWIGTHDRYDAKKS